MEQNEAEIIDQNLQLLYDTHGRGLQVYMLLDYDGQKLKNPKAAILYFMFTHNLIYRDPSNIEYITLTNSGAQVLMNGGWSEYLRELEKQKKVADFEYNAKRFWWIPLIVSVLALIVAIASYFND